MKLSDRLLAVLEKRLSGHRFIVGAAFTVADILMVTVLREVRAAEVLQAYPYVTEYVERSEARPAWVRTVREYEKRLGVRPGDAN